MINHFDYIAEALTDEFEGTEDDDIDPNIGPIIYYYAFDLEWGTKGNVIPYKGTNYPVDNLKDLYNILTSIKLNK